jgi:hypothetical protein
MVLTRAVRKGIDWFLVRLDSEGVGLFQAIVYVHAVIGALYLWIAANGDTPDAVQDTLGGQWERLWLWLCMGPAFCLLGKVMCWWDATRYGGFLFQLGGDIFGLTAFVVYVYATVDTAWFGKALWAVFICAAIAECVLLLVVRDVRRIGQVERRVRR